MYNAALVLHSSLRWLVLLFGLVAIARAIAGRSSGRPWGRADDLVSASFIGMLDLQMLIGLVLYFALSPITSTGMQDLGGAMGNTGLRFWTIEHPFGMIVAIALAHVARARIRKAGDAVRQHRTALIFFTLALLVILITIPWPGRAAIGRPLLRLGS